MQSYHVAVDALVMQGARSSTSSIPLLLMPWCHKESRALSQYKDRLSQV